MPIIQCNISADTDKLINTARVGDPDDRKRFAELVGEAQSRPGSAVYESRSVETIDGDDITIGGVTFHARPLCRMLKAGMTVYPYVATCGPDMAGFGDALTDVLDRYWWDVIMQDAVGRARKSLVEEIEKVAGYAPVSANPGSIEMWPISNQPALFSMIGDVQGMIGVTIAPSFLMVPLKSISGIFFQGGADAGDIATAPAFTHNCCLCERENCPNRSAPFDAKLKAALENDMF
ncbi:MAG: hypothetical protein FWH01_09105 [Oscillospiraceae bacterium]|nr:hypothetical protein [Oscillospiraceae bacterium]